MKTLPFPFSLVQPLRSSSALIRATAVDAAVLAGHLLLYPTGLVEEHPCEELAVDEGVQEPDGGSAPQPPVLLLHGFIDNRSVFVLLRRSLRHSARRQVEGINYSPFTCDIPAAAALLGERVERACRRTGHDRVDLVGHSLGGLIARYYVQRLGGDRRVRTLVTLGTPHGGTRMAPAFSPHPIVRQMRPGSAVIQELRQPAPGCRTRFVSFWSDADEAVSPAEMARIDHPDLLVRNVRVKGVGHLALPLHRATAAGVCEALGVSGTDGTEAVPDADRANTAGDTPGAKSAGITGGAKSGKGARRGGADASGAASVA
ncbi:lipase family alpha/beta hydrolase [Streptomyces palmae]|uniref:Alpha/beta fold hydrolase n=1 Tax=Streptomyces palmae TaxID=1701085 RepID=A0A4Z0G6C7_9ACTN|nr:alpha/beta fold hydrolase [Streptomyces palmae]TGA91594.1 alpha/beta fold hydrolase [Streptomyces palmae]